MNEEPPIDTSGITRGQIRFALSGYIVGMLATLWQIPAEALKVPTEEARHGDLLASYYPITTTMLFFLFLALLGIFLTFRYNGSKQSRIDDFSEEQRSN